jgi:hypothetical protein
MNLVEAQQAITKAYADGVLEKPRVNVTLAQKATIEVLVLGEVNQPGMHPLPKFQNDVGHALAMAGGFTADAGDFVEVHRRIPQSAFESAQMRPELEWVSPDPEDPKSVLRIPLRGFVQGLQQTDMWLQPGDVITVPNRKNDVFWVVGELNDSNLVRFTLGDRDRELGAGLVLPKDRDIDVVTAVVMAGYIDPIYSPSKATLQRTGPNGERMLIRVDLMKARTDRMETVLVQPGDIIYLDPDHCWWFRRTFDRVLPQLITIPYAEGAYRWSSNSR